MAWVARFDLRSGAVIGGPVVFAQLWCSATERDGHVEIRPTGPLRPFYVTAGAQDGERVRPPLDMRESLYP